MWYVVVKLKREREGAKGERRKERRGERVARGNISIQPFREESSGITPGENFQICGRRRRRSVSSSPLPVVGIFQTIEFTQLYGRDIIMPTEKVIE